MINEFCLSNLTRRVDCGAGTSKRAKHEEKDDGLGFKRGDLRVGGGDVFGVLYLPVGLFREFRMDLDVTLALTGR